VLADTTSRMPAEAQPLWAERIRIAQEQGMAAHVQPTLERWFTAPYRAAHPEVMERIGSLIRKHAAGRLRRLRPRDCRDRHHRPPERPRPTSSARRTA
jgi:3-oxoadipate enol-lactonase